MNTGPPPTLILRKLWFTMGWLLVVVVIYLSLTPGRLPLDALTDDEIMHRLTYGIGHVLAYGTLMLWFLQLYPVSQRPIIALCLVALGGLLEILQAFIPERDADYLDVLANGTGIVLGWVLGRTRLARTLGTLENALVRLIN